MKSSDEIAKCSTVQTNGVQRMTRIVIAFGEFEEQILGLFGSIWTGEFKKLRKWRKQ